MVAVPWPCRSRAAATSCVLVEIGPAVAAIHPDVEDPVDQTRPAAMRRRRDRFDIWVQAPRQNPLSSTWHRVDTRFDGGAHRP